MITTPLRAIAGSVDHATVRDANNLVLFIAPRFVSASVVSAVNANDKLIEALRIIKNQSIGSDWTAEQAVAFIKQYASEVLNAVDGARSVAVHELCNQHAMVILDKSDPAMATPSLAAMTRNLSHRSA